MRKFLIAGAVILLIITVALFVFPANASSKAAPSEWHDRVVCTTNSTGHCSQVYAHPLGVMPVVQVTSEGLTAIVHTYQVNDSSFRVRVMQNTTTAWANRAVTLAVSAFVPVKTDPPSTPPTTSPTVQPSISVPPTSNPPSTSPSVPPTSEPPVTADYPTESTTGVPAGTNLTVHSGNLIVTTANAVIDSRRVTGNVDIRAAGVVIKNSQIDGIVVNDNVSAHPAFTIQDSTVGTATCSRHTAGAIGTKNYTAKRVKLQNFPDGFRIAGSNVLIQDSYIKLCSADPADHSDGIQAYGAGAANNIVIDHNVIDQTPVAGDRQTAPIFIPNDAARQGNQGITVTITNNVLAGGSYSLVLSGPLAFNAPSVSNNKIVNNTWGWGPVDVACNSITTWKGNVVVTYNFQTGKIIDQIRSLDDEC